MINYNNLLSLFTEKSKTEKKKRMKLSFAPPIPDRIDYNTSVSVSCHARGHPRSKLR